MKITTLASLVVNCLFCVCVCTYQVLQDWHLLLMVVLCVVVDVLILTVAVSVESARLMPVEMRDVRHGTEVDVSARIEITAVL